MMLGINETMDQLPMVNIIHWYGYVLRREDGHVLRKVLAVEVGGQMNKWRLKKTLKKHI